MMNYTLCRRMIILNLFMIIIARYKAEQCPRNLNYHVITNDGPSLLPEEIISSHKVKSPVQENCNYLCFQEPRCVGFNFRTKSDDKCPVNCQLTNTAERRLNIGQGEWTLFYDVDATKKIKERKRKNDIKSSVYMNTVMSSSLVRNLVSSALNVSLIDFHTSVTPSSTKPGPLTVSSSQIRSSAVQTTLSTNEAKSFNNSKSNEIKEKSCKYILAANKSAVSGVYWIKPAPNRLLQVYCEMDTLWGGGWTMVYSYTFTNYKSFTSSGNAVTPRPNWPASDANVPISTTPPLSESSLGAVDWNLWKDIGNEFMIKSNINDWIVCKPIGGRLVTKTPGSISCVNAKNVATACSRVIPYTISWYPAGPSLMGSSYFYFFDGRTDSNWPTHDPCGRNVQNQKKGVKNPGGQIYLK